MPLDRLLLLLFTANLATFGSGRLMVPILENSLVQESGALTLDQFLFAFTVGRITPGPANLYVASIGWMLHGLPGALLAAAVVLLPGYLILPLASGYRRLQDNGAVRGFGRGLMAGAVGLLLASTIDIGRSTLVSPAAVGVCVLTLFLLHVLRWPTLLSLAVGSVAGLALVLAGQGAYPVHGKGYRARKAMWEGLPTPVNFPVNARAPLPGVTAKEVMLSLRECSTYMKAPLGSIPRWRG